MPKFCSVCHRDRDTDELLCPLCGKWISQKECQETQQGYEDWHDSNDEEV